MLPSLTSVLLILHCVFWAVVFRLFVFPENDSDVFPSQANVSYDYIIVGAGSAGSVLASRLSEDSHVIVLLMEAGGDDRNQPSLDIPMLLSTTQKGKFDWEYYTEPQRQSSFGLTDRQSFWPRGRALGGSSQLNYMMYVRGHRHDYDKWAANGCVGWSYKDVLPYFKKSENIQIRSLRTSEYHGTQGPLTVSQAYLSPMANKIIKAAHEMGYPETDYNGENQEGFSSTQVTVDNGERMSTSKAYLWPVIGRSNLHVLIDSHISKIIIKNKKAFGVEYIKDGRLYKVKSTREIILSAGAIGSPQLLMVSGIGPKKHLDAMKIPVEEDLAVGENLQDHLMIMVPSSIKKRVGFDPEEVDSLWAKLQYKLFRTGIMSSIGGSEVLGFITSKKEAENPDVELMFDALPLERNLQSMLSYDVEVQKHLTWKHPDGLISIPCLLRPKSRGTIRLRSTNPFEYPVIDPNYLADPEDVKTMIRGVRFIQKMHKTKPYKEVGAEISIGILPRCKNLKYDTDEFWECYIRSLATTIYHPSGTCKMGNTGENDTVVDPRLRVKGIAGLRVVDAAIMPTIVSGNTNAPTIMIAEKGADLIREDNNV